MHTIKHTTVDVLPAPGLYSVGLSLPDAAWNGTQSDQMALAHWAVRFANSDVQWWSDATGKHGVNVLGAVRLKQDDESPAGSSSAATELDVPVVTPHWNRVLATTRAIPTFHSPNSYAWQRVNPKTGQRNPMHDILYSRLAEVGTDHLRYMNAQDANGLSNRSACPEPTAPDPKAKTTSWRFDIDEFVTDFCGATKGGDCRDTVMYLGPLPPFFFYEKPKSSVVCNANDSSLCTGPLIDSSGEQAGQYFRRIVSHFTKGFFLDEFGNNITGGHHFNFTHWEVLNEPNNYVHFGRQVPRSADPNGLKAMAVYTKVYDGITTVLKKDHPLLEFVAMSWAGIPSKEAVSYFMNPANHARSAPWPPAVLSFHIYQSPEGHDHTKVQPGLTPATVAAAQDVVSLVSKASGGNTTTFVDELGVFPCSPIDYSTVLDSGSGRFRFHNLPTLLSGSISWHRSVSTRLQARNSWFRRESWQGT